MKPLDKEGNFVIMDKDQYVAMANRLLRDRDTFKILESNPTLNDLSELRQILATMYALPEVHKKNHPIPGRPVLLGNDKLQRLSVFMLKTCLSPLLHPCHCSYVTPRIR